jgi:hypothetical protein
LADRVLMHPVAQYYLIKFGHNRVLSAYHLGGDDVRFGLTPLGDESAILLRPQDILLDSVIEPWGIYMHKEIHDWIWRTYARHSDEKLPF